MELSKRQIVALRLLNDNPDARLYWRDGNIYSHIEIGDKREQFADQTIEPIVYAGFVKNVGSLRYKHYTISPSGQRALKGVK